MSQRPRVVGAAVLVAAFCVSCSPSSDEPLPVPADGGATQATEVIAEAPALSLAYPIDVVESDAPRTIVPTVAGRTSGGGSVLSDNLQNRGYGGGVVGEFLSRVE